jgi:hypothetical protein
MPVCTDDRTPAVVRMHAVTDVPEGIPTIPGQPVPIACAATQAQVRTRHLSAVMLCNAIMLLCNAVMLYL